MLENIPNGVYTGFSSLPETKLHAFSPGMLGLIGYPRKPENAQDHKYSHLELFYISSDRKFQILNNMEVLLALRDHKLAARLVPEEVEHPSPKRILELRSMIEDWIKRKFVQEDLNLLNLVADGGTLKSVDGEIPADRYSLDNYDLITWFVVSRNKKF